VIIPRFTKKLDVTLSLSNGDSSLKTKITLRQAQGDIEGEIYCVLRGNHPKFKLMKKIKSIFIVTFLFSITACAYWPFGKEAPQCYWMENFSGDYKWVSAKEFLGTKYDKRECYEADSCDGGLSQSGGGCYKWSKGANGKRQSWDDVRDK